MEMVCADLLPPWKSVATTAIRSGPTYSALHEALKRPIVNNELQIAPHVNFLTVNIGSDVPSQGVGDSEKLEGVMHVTGMGPCIPLHPSAANKPSCLIIVEVPRGLVERIRCVVSRNLVLGTLVLVVGDAYNVTCVLMSRACWMFSEKCMTTRV